MKFTEIPYWERSLFIAKLYNHAWYDDNRYQVLVELLNEWEKNPPKDVIYIQENIKFDHKL